MKKSSRHKSARAKTVEESHSIDEADPNLSGVAGHWTSVVPLLTASMATAIAGFAVILQHLHPPDLKRLCREDGPVEFATALLYFIAGSIFLFMPKRNLGRHVWYWGFAALFLIVAGEEVSWGQRLLGFDTPKLFKEINVQGEFTVHNLQGVHGRARALGLMVTWLICFIIPMLVRSMPHMQNWCSRLSLPVFPVHAIGPVVLATALMAYPRICLNEVFQNMDETGELLLGLGYLSFPLLELGRARRSPFEFPLELRPHESKPVSPRQLSSTPPHIH